MKPILAAVLISAVLVGGFFYGVLSTLTDDPTDL